MFFVLLSVLQSRDREGAGAQSQTNLRDWSAGAAFGAAMCVKILPLVVLPVLFFCRPGLRRRAIFLAAAAGVMVVCWSPYLFLDPAAIFHQVIGYQSIYGHWGLPWLAYHLTFFRDSWHDAFQQNGAYVALSVIVVGAYVVNRRADKPSVYTQVGAALFFFLAVANGFGVQYLAWLVPWTVGISIIPVAFFSLAGGAFVFLVYNFWCGGLPWYLADSNYVGDFTPHLDYPLAVCWISVIVLAWAVWKRQPSFPTIRTRIIFAALAIPVVIYPFWNQVAHVDARTYPTAVDHAALATIHAHEHAMLSHEYYKMARYTDAVVAARTGVALDPHSARSLEQSRAGVYSDGKVG